MKSLQQTVFGKEKDEFLMQQALIQAYKAFECDEVPVGALVVNGQGIIISQAHNLVEHEHSQRAHAESIAIENACKQYGDWRLDNHWLFVTLEPCMMCMGLIQLSRLAGVVYGAPSPLFGFHLDNRDDLWVYKRDSFVIINGILADETAHILKKFFQQKRKISG